MPKKHRLSRADFVHLLRPARRIHGNYFSLTATPSAVLTEPKVACVVSKKIAARAVDRNRVKRQCREALRPFIKEVQKPTALIFRAKREAVEATFAEIRQDIQKLLERIV